MARLEDIDETIGGYLEALKKHYYETDPRLGEDAEIVKHERALHAINLFWHIHGKLLSWAQAHITGHVILSENPGLAEFLEKKLGHELYEDSHALEHIGLQYNLNPPDQNDPELEKMGELLEEFDEMHPGHELTNLSPTLMRKLVSELLMSTSADNSYWRFDLQDSLIALDEGEVDALATPPPGKHQGLPFSLSRWKLEALRQVRFRVGLGMKKYRALEAVGNAIGQSPETLRSWEKDLVRSVDRSVDLYCSELAGTYNLFFEGDEEAVAPNRDEYASHRNMNHVEFASILHHAITRRDIREIKENILKYRKSKTGG